MTESPTRFLSSEDLDLAKRLAEEPWRRISVTVDEKTGSIWKHAGCLVPNFVIIECDSPIVITAPETSISGSDVTPISLESNENYLLNCKGIAMRDLTEWQSGVDDAFLRAPKSVFVIRGVRDCWTAGREPRMMDWLVDWGLIFEGAKGYRILLGADRACQIHLPMDPNALEKFIPSTDEIIRIA